MDTNELTLSEQLAASTAVANYRNGKGLAVIERPAPQAFMPVMDVEQAYARWEAIQQFIARIMTPDHDFGVIPGSRKPSLLKAGAEKLVAFFGLAPEFDVVQRTEQWDKDGMFAYEIKCRLIRDGQVRGEGLGSCNSRESKYRNRAGADIANTILKMAKKRALVDAVLNTTGASQFFTQDVEDMPREEPRGSREAQQAVQSRKLAELQEITRKPVTRIWPAAEQAWVNKGQMREAFRTLREAVGEVEFEREMETAGVANPGEFRNSQTAYASYNRLVAIAQKEGK
jgi:hypothetical protein